MDDEERRRRDRMVAELADEQAQVIALHQLRAARVTPGRQRAMVATERWQLIPYRGVVVATTQPAEQHRWRRALVQVGRQAWLGGITALQATGLTGFDEPVIHVWVHKSTPKGRPDGVRVHETRRWGPGDVAGAGIPRARPAVATVQAALWSASPRQALLAMIMPVQQRLVRPEDVRTELERVVRHRFRGALLAAIGDVVDGVRSLNELDFALECRRRGLPEPSRQVVRRGRRGRIYLDVYWAAFRVALEINGVQHGRLDTSMADELRAIDLQVRQDAAVQVSVLTLRCDPDPFFAKLAELLVARGWRP